MDILDKTLETEECDATKKEGQINSTEEPIIGGWIGQDGERRKSYSASVMDDIKRKSRIVVGYFIVRNTNSRQNNGEDVVVCLPWTRIEHVTEGI